MAIRLPGRAANPSGSMERQTVLGIAIIAPPELFTGSFGEQNPKGLASSL
jgi:hypothetical protein